MTSGGLALSSVSQSTLGPTDLKSCNPHYHGVVYFLAESFRVARTVFVITIRLFSSNISEQNVPFNFAIFG